jgi:hypothetical protein
VTAKDKLLRAIAIAIPLLAAGAVVAALLKAG